MRILICGKHFTTMEVVASHVPAKTTRMNPPLRYQPPNSKRVMHNGVPAGSFILITPYAPISGMRSHGTPHRKRPAVTFRAAEVQMHLTALGWCSPPKKRRIRASFRYRSLEMPRRQPPRNVLLLRLWGKCGEAGLGRRRPSGAREVANPGNASPGYGTSRAFCRPTGGNHHEERLRNLRFGGFAQVRELWETSMVSVGNI